MEGLYGKLPSVQLSGVVRGCKMRPKDLNLDLEVGEEITWAAAFTSTATSVDVMNTFLGDDGPRTLLQIELTEPVARSIQDFSLFPSENEVLLPPNVCLRFVSKSASQIRAAARAGVRGGASYHY